MRKGQAVKVQPPRGVEKTGKFVQEHLGRLIKDAPTFRARPASVTAA